MKRLQLIYLSVSCLAIMFSAKISAEVQMLLGAVNPHQIYQNGHPGTSIEPNLRLTIGESELVNVGPPLLVGGGGKFDCGEHSFGQNSRLNSSYGYSEFSLAQRTFSPYHYWPDDIWSIFRKEQLECEMYWYAFVYDSHKQRYLFSFGQPIREEYYDPNAAESQQLLSNLPMVSDWHLRKPKLIPISSTP